MSEANALVVLGHEQGSVAAGERGSAGAVEVWLFDVGRGDVSSVTAPWP
jgi:hypothetical protein